MGQPRILTGEEAAAAGATTVEDGADQGPEIGETDNSPNPFANFPDVRSVSVYRKSPEWASGHVTTIHLTDGEAFGERQLDELAHYYGGGLYSLRPVGVSGRFATGAINMRVDGPALYKGQPHPNSPDAWKQSQPHQQQPAQGMVPAMSGPMHHVPRDPQDPLVAILGQLVDRVTSIERQQAPVAPQPPQDVVGQMMGMVQLFKEMKGVLEPEAMDGVDDEDEEEEEEEVSTIEDVIVKIAEKKFLEEDEKGGEAQAASGPRIIPAGSPEAAGTVTVKSAENPTTEGSAKRAETSTLPNSADGLLGVFDAMPPAQKADILAKMTTRITSEEEAIALRDALAKHRVPAG